MRNLTRLIVVLAIMAVLAPSAALAHNNKHNRGDIRGSIAGKFIRPSHSGTVTAVGTNSLTLQTKRDNSITVNTAGATFTRVPNTPIVLADIQVGTKVWVKGMMDNNTLNATAVYVLGPMTQAAKKGGTVTAVNGANITIETKKNGTVTLATDATTVVKTDDGQTGVVADIQVGDTVKAVGFWDKVTNMIQTLKVWIK